MKKSVFILRNPRSRSTLRPSAAKYFPVFHTRAPVLPVFLDEFSGSGPLTAHTPDIAPPGASYTIIAGTFADLSSGILTYASGTYGRAVIDSSLADCELRFRIKHFNVASQASSVLFRSNSAGSDFYEAGTWGAAGVSYITAGIPGAVPLPPSNTVNTQTYPMTAGQYYTFRILLKGPFFRLLDPSGVLLLAANMAAKLTQTYIGPRVQQAYGAWDFIEVKPFTTRLQYFGVCGDSISNDPTEWPGLVSVYHNNGMCYPNNYAQSGAQVVYHLSTQAASVVAANPDYTFIALGTNDGWPSATFETKYYDGLMILHNGLPGKPIYCLGVFPKTVDSDRAGKNAAIQAAVASAAAAGANAVYWNTDGWIDPATDTSDGLHPNAAGQLKICNEILSRLP
jgi:hypothetical protein